MIMGCCVQNFEGWEKKNVWHFGMRLKQQNADKAKCCEYFPDLSLTDWSSPCVPFPKEKSSSEKDNNGRKRYEDGNADCLYHFSVDYSCQEKRHHGQQRGNAHLRFETDEHTYMADLLEWLKLGK